MTTNEMQRAADFIQEMVSTEQAPDPLAPMRFAAALARHTERRVRNRRIAGGALACVLAFLALGLSSAMQPQVLTYRVDNSAELGVLGSYVSASAKAPLGLQFSEGSRVVLQPHAKGRVSQTTRRGATMVLEDGRAHAEIMHRAQTDWRVLAGPFVVGVTGTTFDVAFDVDTQTFELKMHSGTVQVTGPGLKAPVVVRDPQTLVLSARGGEPIVSNTSSAEQSSHSTTPAASASTQCATDLVPTASATPTAETIGAETIGAETIGAATIGAETIRAATPARSSVIGESGSVESFTDLGAKGQHQRIVELAEKQGFDRTVASANRTDLLALGNAARFAGRSGLALMAYRAVRDRFAKSPEATAAAFFLGRLSETSSPSQAIHWYERYVAEAPGGVWAADALGRRLVMLHESKSAATTQAAASEYLERFPAGPYSGFARKILAL